MPDFLNNLLTDRGPLALGWIFFFLVWQENRKITQKLIELYATATASMATLRTLIEERLPRQS